jgi:hypothetical protein
VHGCFVTIKMSVPGRPGVSSVDCSKGVVIVVVCVECAWLPCYARNVHGWTARGLPNGMLQRCNNCGCLCRVCMVALLR